MSLVHWQPMPELDTLRRQMDRLFEDFWSDRGLPLFQTAKMTWMPAIELKETDTELVLRAQIPGISAKDLDIQMSEDTVTIMGEHQEEEKTEEKGFFRSEFHYGKFQRSIALPINVHNQKAKAEFKDGVLTLTMPKMEESKRKVVKLNLNGQ
ncbi:MAG: Hsp20/alpha crystallin family protein [Acaryochloris sp. CRU_2_0]|nr:Hsp20/alpha crystallin family protein [Acaryochloris sp. CRU_2_0]